MDEIFDFDLGAALEAFSTTNQQNWMKVLNPPFLMYGKKEKEGVHHLSGDSLVKSLYLTYVMIAGDAMAEISHPPHLKPSFESSSAFIPFCAFQSNMALSDHLMYMDDIVYPVCSSFQPTILEGQLCFRLQMNSTSAEGKKNQLMLLLDYNEDRSIYASKAKGMQYMRGRIAKKINHVILTLNMDGAADIQMKEAKIHVDTLSSFRGFGGGTFKISDVKKMTTTDDFLNMPFEGRKCETMPYEECRTKKLLEV